MGRALGDTRWFEPRIQAVHAQIAFHRFTVVGIFHRDIPGAGFGAGFTANTLFLVNVDDAIIALNHCLGRTNRNAERFQTMTAGGKNDFGLGYPAHLLQRCTADVTEKRTDGKLLVGLAMYLTAVAGDASTGVELDHVIFHSSILLLVLRILFLTWTKTSQRLTPPPA